MIDGLDHRQDTNTFTEDNGITLRKGCTQLVKYCTGHLRTMVSSCFDHNSSGTQEQKKNPSLYNPLECEGGSCTRLFSERKFRKYRNYLTQIDEPQKLEIKRSTKLFAGDFVIGGKRFT